MRRLRGDRMAMIFQEPMTSLNPVFTIGDQIAEAVLLHRPVDPRRRPRPGGRAARPRRHPGARGARSTATRTSSRAASASA